MSLTVTIGGTDVTDRVRLSDGYQSITSNADGTYASCGLKVDDPDSSLVIGRFEEVIIEEDDCSRPRMFTGFVIEARPSRGPFRSGVERVWNLDVGDLNILLHLQAFHLADAKRPKETLTARRDWFLGTVPGSYFVNNGFFPVFSPDTLWDEVDYRGEYADSVLATFGDIGRIGFLYWDDPDVAVYCAGADDGFATSTLSISNVLADVDGSLVFGPAPDTELTIDMSEVYDEVYLRWAFGQTFLADHDGRLPAGIHRTGVFETPRVGRAATALAEAQILLDRHAGDMESITATIQLPSDKVNLIDAGMLVPVKFSHLPGYTGYVNLRAAQRTVNLAPVTDGTDLFYEVTLKLNLRGIAFQGGGGGSTDGFPYVPAVIPELCATTSLPTYQGSDIRVTEIYRGDFIGNSHDPSVAIEDWSMTGTLPVSGWGSIAIVYSWNGGAQTSAALTAWKPDQATWSPNICWNGGSITECAWHAGQAPVVIGKPTSGTDTLRIFGMGVENLTSVPTTVCLTLGAVTDSSTGLVVPNEIATADDPGPPAPAKWVFGELVTLSGGAGTTRFPFADGSLHVRYDIVDQTAAILSYDGATGAFQMPSDPPFGSQVFVDYQGR